MSLLLFRLEEASIVLVSDTLATTTSGRPMTFMSKLAVVPHMGAVVAVTGVAGLHSRWVNALAETIVCPDLDGLDVVTPKSLRKLWAGMVEEYGTVPSSTIYQFGFSEKTGAYSGLAYRSTSDFASERLAGPCFGVKPQPTGELPAPAQTVEEFINLAERLRMEQDALPQRENAVHIGGELIMTVMADRAITTKRIYRWPNYEELSMQIVNAPTFRPVKDL